jgi:hypothetical protein
MLLLGKLAMKNLLLAFSVLLILHFRVAAEEDRRELDLTEMGLNLMFAPTAVNLFPKQMSVSISNACPHSGVFRLPSPFVDENPSGFIPFSPNLALVVKELKTGREESFVLTSFAKLDGPGKLESFEVGQVRKYEFPLKSFYRWGPCTPDRYGNIIEYFKPGDTKLEIRAELFVFEKEGPRRIRSHPQIIRRSFPEWLFRDLSIQKNDASVKKKGNGVASK